MHTRFGWHGRLAVALGLTASLAVAAPAVAAPTVSVSGGTTTLRLDGKTVRALRRAGVAVSASKPAKLRGGTVSFPVSGGSIDPATAKGTLKHRGGLTLKMGRRKLALTAITLNSGKGTFTAKAGKKSVAFASVKGGKVSRDGFATSVAGYRVAISKKGAAALNKALGGRAFKAGAKLGTAGSKPSSNEIALDRGTTTLAFVPQVAGALRQAGATIAPVAPATADAATGAISFPVTSGTLNARSLFGTIRHGGGLGIGSFTLTDLAIQISAKPTLSTNLGTIADLDVSALRSDVDPQTRTVSLEGVGIRVNQLAATTLDAAFFGSRGVLEAGATIATGSLQATAR
ncbi:hypothetical protein [Conexibacter arvalis]|uniref:Htaa protein n=1 Tax=Conexibacter arvalis TaxID=912552 RepID=A0A840IFZ9_9ACTN|nr:hypothetical protein [Conexibacter arvalis]MBB4663123.1 hypothetical protein [Conexibacter arvalis]